jgi:hypothetical protein
MLREKEKKVVRPDSIQKKKIKPSKIKTTSKEDKEKSLLASLRKPYRHEEMIHNGN